jgi:biopolymer transport protein ExbD
MNRRLARSIFHRHEEEPAVNLTPLIDVVFVILIMFILIAPLLEMEQVELADAPSANVEGVAQVQQSSPISIHVHQNNTISFNNQKVTISQLPGLLAQAKKRHPSARPQLFHDKRGHFGTYQSIKNSVEEAGFKQLDIVLKP